MNNIHDTIAALWISKKNWHFKKYGVFPPENWHHIHLPSPAPLGRGVDNTTAIGRATEVDIRTGWAGHLTPREIKDRWSRHGSVIPANHMDNHLNGTSCASFEKIRWGALWISRALKGWTPLAFLGLEWLGVNRVIETRKEHEGWAFGCPQWFADHQP